MADLHRVEDVPQAASVVYNSHDGGLPFKGTLALFSVSWFPPAGLFLISLYVYGYIHSTGQPGWEFVCFCFVLFFSSQIMIDYCYENYTPHTDFFFFLFFFTFHLQTMAKVITSMLKFPPDQAQKVLEKEDSKPIVSIFFFC